MTTSTRIAGGAAAVGASAVLVLAAVVVGGPSAAAGGDDENTLRFEVEFSPPSYTDLGDPGFSAADVLVFHDELLRDGSQVGHEVGSCVLVEASGLANCTAVVTLDGRGTIAFAFENAPPPEKTLAITGGSGDFRDAGGDGTLVEHGDGTGTLTLSVDTR
jgi:hypothetical protein